MKKTVTCKHCGYISDVIGVSQIEKNFYTLYINTNQLEDCHGDGEVKSSYYFCINCDKTLNFKMVEKLMSN